MKKLLTYGMIFVLITMTTAFAQDTNTPPAMPDGMQQMGTPPAMTDGEQMGTPPSIPDGITAPGGMGGNFGGSMSENSGIGATTLTSDSTQEGAFFTSSSGDENALRVESSAHVSISNIEVSKSGEASNSEDASFYGLNAAILARDGATLVLTGGTVTTDGSGGNAVFAYGTGKIVVSGMKIRTSQNNSGGIMLAGGGTLTASNMDIETQGGSSAAIRTDRGGGSMTVDGGTYVTNGIGSPAVYSTAQVVVSNATLTANHSEGVVIEGKNSVTLLNCDVTGNMTESNGGEGDNLHTIFLYQSMSGDADIGRSDFSMTGGSLTSMTGDTFYVTNTACAIALSGVIIKNADGALLRVAGNTSSRGWGQQGANGGTCTLTATNQVLEGDILVDSISSLALILQQNSFFNGSINPDADAGSVDVTLDDGSTWTLTADAHITAFTGNLGNVNTNGFALYVGGVLAK